MLEGTILSYRVMELMGGIVGDVVTLVDGAIGVIVAWETGGSILLGGAIGWHGSMVIFEAAKMGGMAINEVVGPGGVDMNEAAELDGIAIDEAAA